MRALLLVVGFLLPSAATWLYFYGPLPPAGRQIFYSLSKAFLLILPLVWILKIAREPVRFPRPTKQALVEGLLSGLVIGIPMVAFYFAVLRKLPVMIEAGSAVSEKMATFGLTTPAAFLGLSVFIILMNASIEEYYWRAFIFKRLSERMAWVAAAVLSAFGFMLHHVIILTGYLPLVPTAICSFGVMIGGLVWAWQLHRTKNIYSAWLSHALVDVAVYVIAYDLLFGV